MRGIGVLRAARREVRRRTPCESGRTRERAATLARLRADPCLPMRALGLTPDPWQRDFLRATTGRETMLCCRRAGKSTAAAAKALRHCLTTPDAACLVFSPTLRQSYELARLCRQMDRALGYPLPRVRQNLGEVEWANGSRLLSLPDNHEGVVGFTPTLIVIDEGSRVSDDCYRSVRPMLALGKAALVTLSTPFGRRGWFFETWADAARLARYRHWRITADHCPRISREFLAEELDELGERWWRQEYYCSFEDAADAVFDAASIEAAFAGGAEPLFAA